METHGIRAGKLKRQSWKPTIFCCRNWSFEWPVFFSPEHVHKMYHIRQHLQFDVVKNLNKQTFQTLWRFQGAPHVQTAVVGVLFFFASLNQKSCKNWGYFMLSALDATWHYLLFSERFFSVFFVEKKCSQVKWWPLFFMKRGEDFFWSLAEVS